MNELITILVKFLLGYTVTHYSLATVWANRTGVIVTAAIMGVLSVLFLAI